MDGRRPSPLPPEPAAASQQPKLTMRKIPQPSCVDDSPSPKSASVPSPPRQALAQPIPQPPPMGPPLGANVDPKQPNTSRSRATSRPPPILHQQGTPIKDAVNNAFDQSSTVQNQLDPELVRQVTEQVIRNLQTANIAPGTPTVLAHPQAHSPYQAAAQPSRTVTALQRSPTQSSTDSAPRRLTPPSPEKDLGKGDGKYELSPRLPPSDDDDSVYSKESMRSAKSTQSADTARMVQPEEVPSGGARRREGAVADLLGTSHSFAGETARTLMRTYRAGKAEKQTQAARVPSDVLEPTTLERIWQPLFENGMPTVRLGQFLRGLANHLIDDYEPKGSLVVTPAKMLRFFSETKLGDERYPWDILFGNRMPTVSLSKVYQKLFCQHHLVQGQPHEIPYVPALTPNGFATFMTVLIEAHPDMEFERLSQAVMNMPVSNADSKTERFPKELSRRLLPKDANVQAEQRIIASLNHEPFLMSQLRGTTAMPPPPPASAPPQSQAFVERERKPYYSTPFANTVDDEDLAPHAMPLERERKPYFAKEGSGKMYSDGERERDRDRDRDNRPPASYKHVLGDGIPAPTRRASKSSQSIPTQSSLNSGSAAEPMNVPPSRSHRQSMGPGPPPAMTNGSGGTYPKGPSRRATPPPRNPYARSEPFDVGGVPPSEYASNLTSRNTPNMRERDQFGGNPDDEFLRRKPSRKSTTRSNDRLADSRGGGGSNGTDDDLAAGVTSTGRGYPIPPRPPPSTTQGYESGYASAHAQQGAAGGVPVSSYSRDRFGSDARRQTWYGASNPEATNGGTDGYGSSLGNSNIAGGYTYGSSMRD
ncbi:hypothetical protein Tdes44962_MAKER03972 [Teratosphaeria destructans]|uniref:DUF7514 domain-containing protein n=1 Tax=Teratosphaeria destructans TaxID=418781 RepID=A0A9W7SNQ3_9PEZI|nr:hypothetical protein Tdes44962_MAKER03972 [Teratosphaeria destructans]